MHTRKYMVSRLAARRLTHDLQAVINFQYDKRYRNKSSAQELIAKGSTS